MFYYLTIYLSKYAPIFSVFQNVGFRGISALMTASFLSLLFGDWFIKKSLNLFKAGPREYTPETHKKKTNIPTMGGLFILLNVIVSVLLWNNLFDHKIWVLLSSLIIFGFIGLIDDLNKINKKRGISASGKFILQVTSALIIVLGWLYFAKPEMAVNFSIFKSFSLDLGIFFIFWAIFVIVGTSNAVNLTDGLDGLAISSLIPNFALFSIISLMGLNYTTALTPFVQNAEFFVFGGILVGASLGFLWFNSYPAQIFMGDIGSLSMGACLAMMALMLKQEILLIISGGIFVIETISVILQVLSYKTRGKKLFKMSPIHHHFELIGWPEAKITTRFTIITLILCVIAFFVAR